MKASLLAIACLTVLIALGTTSCSQEAEANSHSQKYCPVMSGNKINPDIYVDADGKRIYVCCPDCIATIKADPAKYISQLEADGVILEDAPAADTQE